MRTTMFMAALGTFAVACPSPEPTSDAKPTTASSQPAGAASQPGGAASAPAARRTDPIAGVIKLADGVDAGSVKPTDVLFVMARESHGGGKAGRLVAVQRYAKVTFPKRFELTSQDSMVPGVPFKGPFVVYARLDKDGDPMTKGDEDLYGAIAGDVSPGNEAANIVLGKKASSPTSKPVSAPAH